jgi:hypothetical protein
MFKYKVGTVRLFGTQENLSLALQGLQGNFDAVLTEEYLQFIVPKIDIADYKNNIETLCEEGHYTGAVIWEGLHYGQPIEKTIFSWNTDNWNITRDTLKNSGFIKEYYVYRNSAEYTQEKQLRQINKVENTLLRLQKTVANV